jgi:hypothetical protein
MSKRKAAWTPEKRARHSKVMKRIWDAKRQAMNVEPPTKNWFERILDVVRGAR